MSKAAVRDGRSLFDALCADAEIMQHLSPDELKRLLDPAHYVGSAHAYVDAVLALHTAHTSSKE